MKILNIVAVLIIAVLLNSCKKSTGDEDSDLNKFKLHGSVKSVTEIDYSKSGEYKTYIIYNSFGYILQQTAFNPDGSLIKKWIYTYDDNNKKTSRACYVLKDSLSEILHYKYNNNNKITEEILLNDKAGLISKTLNKYDINQNLVETTVSTSKFKVQGKINYRYNKMNKLTEEIYYDSILHHTGKLIYAYNKDGLNSEISYKTLSGVLIKRIAYMYLSNKLPGEADQYDDKNKIISKTSYRYDENDNIILKQTNNIAAKLTETHAFKYTYDKYKNWIFRYEYIDNKLDDIISRKLEYY